MTISPETTTFLAEILNAEIIPEGKMAYFRSRLANRFHALVLTEFARLEAEGKINRATLAKRISREPAQITRWLGSAGNWTSDTLSDLLLGMGCEPGLTSVQLASISASEAKEDAGLPKREELPSYSMSNSLPNNAANDDAARRPPKGLPSPGIGQRYQANA